MAMMNEGATTKEKNMTREEIKAAIELLASERGESALDIITAMQMSAVALDDGEATLNALCEIKREMIGL